MKRALTSRFGNNIKIWTTCQLFETNFDTWKLYGKVRKKKIMQTAIARKKILSETTLKRGAIKADIKNPFTWASKTKNPFYNNNRVLLDKYEDRMLVGQSLVQLAEELGIEYDAVLGTSMAGIGPAATVAELTGKPLLINHEGVFYKFELQELLDEKEDMCYFSTFSDTTEVISSTIPFGIPHGVWLANKMKKRFSFVRPKPKNHGLNKQVEGKPQPGDKVLLMNYFQGDEKNYTKEAIEGIETEGGIIKNFYNCNFPQHSFISVVEVNGLRVLVIEDLVSTGGSSYKEVQALRDAGASVDYLLSIFSYGLPDEKVFAENNCGFQSLLTFQEFLPIAVEGGYISKEEEKVLNEWWPNQKNWGIENGFPPAE